jgi:hypothetical protein
MISRLWVEKGKMNVTFMIVFIRITTNVLLSNDKVLIKEVVKND